MPNQETSQDSSSTEEQSAVSLSRYPMDNSQDHSDREEMDREIEAVDQEILARIAAKEN